MAKFFQDEIIKKLEEQFDVLCEEMINLLKPEVIDVDGGATHIQKYAKNVRLEEIKNLLNDISKVKDRKTHVVVNELNKTKVTYEKKADEPKKTLTKFVTQVEKKELEKIKTYQVKYAEFTKTITNPEARRFFLTYYSGELKNKVDFAEMFSNFINFVENVCGIKIEETNENRKEFLIKIDKDKSLTVDFGELNDFFNEYVDIANKNIKLDMAKGNNAPSQFPPLKVRMEVLEDFDAESSLNQVACILRKKDIKELEVPDGKIVTFGKDATNDVVILADDIDVKQFSIFNFSGQLYLVDESTEFPTRIKVLPGRSYRLNEGDFINVGLE